LRYLLTEIKLRKFFQIFILTCWIIPLTFGTNYKLPDCKNNNLFFTYTIAVIKWVFFSSKSCRQTLSLHYWIVNCHPSFNVILLYYFYWQLKFQLLNYFWSNHLRRCMSIFWKWKTEATNFTTMRTVIAYNMNAFNVRHVFNDLFLLSLLVLSLIFQWKYFTQIIAQASSRRKQMIEHFLYPVCNQKCCLNYFKSSNNLLDAKYRKIPIFQTSHYNQQYFHLIQRVNRTTYWV